MNRFAFDARPIHPALRGLVSGLWHYDEQRDAPLRRREMPGAEAVLLFNLGPRIGVSWPDPAAETGFDPGAGFFARPHAAPARSFMSGSQRGLQVVLTPLGAERLLRTPMSSLRPELLDLRTALGPGGAGLGERLAGTVGPDACLDLMQGQLLRWLACTPPPADAVAQAWQRIEASGGRLGIGALAGELGLSRQTLVTRFHARTGLTPKLAARLKRFGGVLSRIAAGPGDWAGLAAEAGYADQAHLIRECSALTGLTPGALLRRRLPDGLGFAEDA